MSILLTQLFIILDNATFNHYIFSVPPKKTFSGQILHVITSAKAVQAGYSKKFFPSDLPVQNQINGKPVPLIIFPIIHFVLYEHPLSLQHVDCVLLLLFILTTVYCICFCQMLYQTSNGLAIFKFIVRVLQQQNTQAYFHHHNSWYMELLRPPCRSVLGTLISISL